MSVELSPSPEHAPWEALPERMPAGVQAFCRVLPCARHCAKPRLYPNLFHPHSNPNGVGTFICAILQTRTEAPSGEVSSPLFPAGKG